MTNIFGKTTRNMQMKKLFTFFIVGLLSISAYSCNEVGNTTTVDGNTSTETTSAASTQSTTSTAFTTEPFLTSDVVTTTQTSTVVTTTIEATTVTTDGRQQLVFNEVNGEGSISNPYEITVTENVITDIQMNNLSETAYFDFLEGVIVGDVFYGISQSDIPRIDLSQARPNQLTFMCPYVGVFHLRISGEGYTDTYLKINVVPYYVDYTKNLKVLAIGNSFSVDGMEYLYKIAADYGVENIILGILYIPGASLATHVNSINNGLSNYVYYKNNADVWTYHNSNATLLDGLLDEEWDVITIQQVSGYSGLPDTYNTDIDTIINYVKEHRTNPNSRFVWHMTWAYQGNSTHPDFVRYSSNQLTMYQAITAAVQNKIVDRDDISYVIPSGTAIQNLRTSYFGDTITRDGYHLSLDLGRYTASMTWFKMITGLSIDLIEYCPDSLSSTDLLVVKEAVNNAIAYPYQITDSSYPNE